MRVAVTRHVELSQEETWRVVSEFIAEITQGRWLDGDRIMEETYTSPKYYYCVGDVNDQEHELLVAALRFSKALAKVRK